MLLTAAILAQAATESDPVSLWGIVQTGGIAGILFLGLYLVFSGRIPTKQQLTQLEEEKAAMTADRDFWRGLALKGTNLIESHIQVSDEELSARLLVIEKTLSAKDRDGA